MTVSSSGKFPSAAWFFHTFPNSVQGEIPSIVTRPVIISIPKITGSPVARSFSKSEAACFIKELVEKWAEKKQKEEKPHQLVFPGSVPQVSWMRGKP
jgi:hypothetical protein